MGEFLSVERRGKIAILTMIKPESMNAIGTHEDCQDIIETLRILGEDRSVSAIILTGSGKAFSAGGNLKGMQERQGIGVLDQPDSTRANYRKGVQAVIRALMDCEVPMIAAVNGHAIGLGADLACTCDIRIAAESAKFACSFIKVGIVPGDGGAWYLPRIVGRAKAFEMAFTGDVLKADECLEIGLVHKVVPHDELMDACMSMAKKIAAKPPEALRMTKRLLKESESQSLASSLEMAAGFQALAQSTKDHEEAALAFVEKRKPVFTGR